MTVTNAIFWQEIVSIRIRLLILLRRVSRVPIEQQIRRSNRSKHLGCFRRSCGITSGLILENQNHILLRRFFGGVPQLFVHSRSISPLIIQSPEIETADAIGLERLSQLDTAFQHFILLLKRKVCVELIALWAVL